MRKPLSTAYPLLLITALLATGCASYKQNIMMVPPDDFKSATVTNEILKAERNYVIQKNDILNLEVYTNKGEKIIDPNPEITNPDATKTNQGRPQVQYLVDLQGVSKLPVVGDMHLEGLTLRQAEAMIQVEYDKFFKEAFVVLTFANKRVIVLGAVGGLVVPLTNHNVTLAEILAASKGLPNDSKVKNIRIVRNDTVFIVDLSTIEGFQKGNMIIEPGDIIYVEPVRKPFAEGLRDYAGVASLVFSLLSLIIVANSVK